MLVRCKQFNFDKANIDQRLSFLGLSTADLQLAIRLNKEVIKPNLDSIIERFYENLLLHPENKKWLINDEMISRLKLTQGKYLLSLGIDFDTEEYFEHRLEIGIMHAVVELPLSIYQCAYSNLIQYILGVFPESIVNNESDYLALTNFVIKITSLDMSLAIETYHHSFITGLEDEVTTANTREKKFKNLAETDSLTGLYNRKYTFTHLNDFISNAHQYSNNLNILMLDIDYFKKVNDTYGHQAGDEVLKLVALEITKILRENDIVGRYGGEEFILGLLDVKPEVAKKVAQRICDTIARTPIVVDDLVINITVSIGLAHMNVDDDLQSLIKRADSALYSAKSSGRNCVVCG